MPEETDEEITQIGEMIAPLSKILGIFYSSTAASEAPNEQIKAYVLGISLPKLRNILRVGSLGEGEIDLLDECNIPLPIAAMVAMVPPEKRAEKLSREFVLELSRSPSPLSDIWLLIEADNINDEEMFSIFFEEGYLGKALNSRGSQLGRAKDKWERGIRSILGQVARNKRGSPKQLNAIKSRMIMDSDTAYLWSSEALKRECPKSVSIVEQLTKSTGGR